MQAVFLGQSDQDYAGPSTEVVVPGGAPDWHIQLTGLTAMPTEITIEAPNDTGTWAMPPNGTNWVIAVRGTPAQVDCYFEPNGEPSASYTVTATVEGALLVADAFPGTVPPEPTVPPLTETEIAWMRENFTFGRSPV